MDNLPLPTPFMLTPGSPVMPWNTWIRTFRNNLTAAGATGTEFPKERQIALLVHYLGAEGQRIYYSILPSPPPTTLKATISLLQGHFAPQENVVAARYKFRSRGQFSGETFDAWYSELKSLVANCNYRDLESEMLRDQIVEKTASSRVRERLLMEKDLTLDIAITVARQIEQAIKDSKAITAHPAADAVNRVHSSKYSAPPSRKGACFCCGEEGHWAKNPQCPALRATCDVCGKVGHLPKVCRSRDAAEAAPARVNTVHCPDNDSAPDMIII